MYMHAYIQLSFYAYMWIYWLIHWQVFWILFPLCGVVIAFSVLWFFSEALMHSWGIGMCDHVWIAWNFMEVLYFVAQDCPGHSLGHKKLFSFWVGTCCDQFRGTVFEATPLALWMLCCCIVYASTIRKSDSQIGYTWIYNYIYTCTYNAAMERDTMPVIHSVCGIHNGRSATTMCFCVSLVCLCQIFPQLMPHIYIYNYIYTRTFW